MALTMHSFVVLYYAIGLFPMQMILDLGPRLGLELQP